jgi:signal transduction histidine kinase/CheY-like chemotaxis protein
MIAARLPRWRACQWQPYLVALLIIGAASALRAWVFADLGRATAYLTYYPAVVLAALYGGLYVGLATTGAAAFLCFYWIQQGYMTHVETLAMGAFLLSCTMISGIAEAMIRAKARAKLEKERAEAANLAKSAFLARMSHELRTPMNAILGFAEILRRDAGMSAEQRKNLEIINRSGEHLLALINDVLDMAKIDAGRMVVENTTFNLSEMVHEVADLLRLRAEARNLELVLDQSSDLPRFVHADVTKLRQAIINLVGNAIKFTEQGGVTLRLRALPGDSARCLRLIIEVEDSGVGIAAADQQRVFDPFTQVGHSTLQKGTGLGLAITRRFVDLMGGQIGVQSTPGKGSTFRVELPVDPADPPAPGLPVPAGRIVGLAPGQPEYRVLIVEDQVENWELLRQLLEPIGFQVRVAENGRAGIEMFENWRPQFIWMDIRMPVMDGLEATRRIRTLDGGQSVKIVAITASVFAEEIDNVRTAGMNDLIRKPFRREEIYDCLRRYLGVIFIREEASVQGGPEQASAILRPEAVASLPEALRADLREAILSLESERIAAVIERVAVGSPQLGGLLFRLAGQFNYSAILQALNAAATPDTGMESEA